MMIDLVVVLGIIAVGLLLIYRVSLIADVELWRLSREPSLKPLSVAGFLYCLVRFDVFAWKSMEQLLIQLHTKQREKDLK